MHVCYNTPKIHYMNDSYTRKKGLVYKNQFHIIFCPKYRRPVLVDGVDERLKEILFSTASEFDGWDNVHSR